MVNDEVTTCVSGVYTCQYWLEDISTSEFKCVREDADFYPDCDGHGTCLDCRLYKPFHMAFSAINPCTTPEFKYRLPLNFDIYNLRAKLGRCYWWEGPAGKFSVNSSGVIQLPPNLCACPDEQSAIFGDFFYKPDLGAYVAPCNGAKPECPNYISRICWKYCIDEYMLPGDRVLAEQILELRYYLYEDRWNFDRYYESFYDGDLYAWDGGLEQVSYMEDEIYYFDYVIPSRRVYFKDFNEFKLSADKAVLSAGMPAEGTGVSFPTLVRVLDSFDFSPRIRNVFDRFESEKISCNIFETSNINHKYITIFGDKFYYDSETYAFNLNDPNLDIPVQVKILLSYDNLLDAKANLAFFEEMYGVYLNYIEYLIEFHQDSMIESEFGDKWNMFCMDVPSFFGENTIVVIDKPCKVDRDNLVTFGKVSFTKVYIGGVVCQTGFEVKGEGDVNYLPSYEDSFMCDLNKNGKILFDFSSFVLGLSTHLEVEVAYMYLDGVKERLPVELLQPPVNKTWEFNYKLYKREYRSFSIDRECIKFFGNAGYALVTLPREVKTGSSNLDNVNEYELDHLADVIKPWEIEDEDHNTDIVSLIYLNDDSGEEYIIKMEVIRKGGDQTERLPINQFIIRPINILEFKPPCGEVKLKIDCLRVYERHTASEQIDKESSTTPGNNTGNKSSSNGDIEEIREDFVDKKDQVIYKEVTLRKPEGETLQEIVGDYCIEKFSNMPLAVAVVFKGLSGRIIGQVKTKLIMWVRQPYCRDVEIYYNWSANYLQYDLLPERAKYGLIGIRTSTPLVSRSYTPPCGDHDLSVITLTGPMWYPYDSCDKCVWYNIRNNIVYDTGIMEVFLPNYSSDLPHGQHDIRMLGPADNFGEIYDVHASLWTCFEDWSYRNLEKKGENIFSGYARYRGGLSFWDKLKAVQYAGTMPKFGNTYRDFLRSFRAVDNVDYYFWNGYKYIRKSKWVPMYEFYSDMDIDNSITDCPLLMYISNDYYQDKSVYLDQFGLLLAVNIEDIDINETILLRSLVNNKKKKPIRLRFEEVFNTHSGHGIYYPYPKHLYVRGNNLVPCIPWYTYRDNPLGDNNSSIQWAWRELWKPLERSDAMLFNPKEKHIGVNPNSPVITEFTDTIPHPGNTKFLFLDIKYPPYKYDYTLKEHRLVCDEGEQHIFIAPPKEKDGSYGPNPLWGIRLNEGPTRYFDINGNWADGIAPENGTLYETCTHSPWVTEVSLFDTGYTSTEPVDERTIITYDDTGNEVKTYYQRGLNITLKPDKFSYLPYELHSYDSNWYLRLSRHSDFGNLKWRNCEGLFYPLAPGEFMLGIGYNCLSADYITMTALLRGTGSLKQVICVGAITITFKIGAEESLYTKAADLPFRGKVYHIPAVEIFVSDNDESYIKVYEDPEMVCFTKTDPLCTVSLRYDFSRKMPIELKIRNLPYVKLRFRLRPNTEELKDASVMNTFNDPEIINCVYIDSIYFHLVKFVDASERIVTYERKYAVSVGEHGDFPPHGFESTGSLLYPPASGDSPTVYQRDSITGVIGMPNSSGECKTMNKLRGRIMKECHHDKEPIPGPKDPHYYETIQKKIHDAIISEGNTEFILYSTEPPFILDKFYEMDTGVKGFKVFPGWECKFINTLIRPLAEIVSYAKYSPCGHKFIHDFNTLRHVPCVLCGHYMPVPCVWKDIHDVVFIRACDENFKQVPNWAVVAYYHGIGNVLVRPFEYYIAPTVELTEHVASLNLHSWKGVIKMQFSEGVRPLY